MLLFPTHVTQARNRQSLPPRAPNPSQTQCWDNWGSGHPGIWPGPSALLWWPQHRDPMTQLPKAQHLFPFTTRFKSGLTFIKCSFSLLLGLLAKIKCSINCPLLMLEISKWPLREPKEERESIWGYSWTARPGQRRKEDNGDSHCTVRTVSAPYVARRRGLAASTETRQCHHCSCAPNSDATHVRTFFLSFIYFQK